MSWKSIACVAVFGALTAPALAVPTIQLVDNLNGTGSFYITTTDNGSIAAELTLELTGATLGGATINSGIFDTANPGDNPFQPGSPEGGDASGLVLDLANNRLFASYGSVVRAPGQHKLLDFTYTGNGTAKGDGLVGSIGVLTDVAAVTINIGGTPAVPGDANGDGKVDAADFSVLAGNWLANPAPAPGGPAVGDFNSSGNVDAADFSILAGNWLFGTSTSSAVAIPEPASFVMVGVGLLASAARRRD